MNRKVLSISIASYNIEKYIEDTVSSLFVDDDRMSKLEIIIVNDGSKDNTSKKAHELEKQCPDSVKVIDKENGGYGSTINSSLSVAQGKYYKLLDGDDWYDTDALASFIDYLEGCDSDLVITPYYEVRDRDILVRNHPELPSENSRIEDINIDNKLFAMHEIAVRTETLRKLNLDITEHCFYTDSEFVFYCIMASDTIACFDRPLYRYRLGVEGQSVSVEGIRKHYNDMRRVAERLYTGYHEHPDKSVKTKKDILDFCVMNITYHAYRAYYLVNDPSKKQDLVTLDKLIRNKYPEIYRISNGSKLVCALRLLHFTPYKLISKYLLSSY